VLGTLRESLAVRRGAGLRRRAGLWYGELRRARRRLRRGYILGVRDAAYGNGRLIRSSTWSKRLRLAGDLYGAGSKGLAADVLAGLAEVELVLGDVRVRGGSRSSERIDLVVARVRAELVGRQFGAGDRGIEMGRRRNRSRLRYRVDRIAARRQNGELELAVLHDHEGAQRAVFERARRRA